MTATFSRDVDYIAAGLFVTFLLARHGPQKFRRFYLTLDWPFTMRRIRARFREVYGFDLDEEVEVYMQGIPACSDTYVDLPLIECSGPTVSWSGPVWVFADSVGCEDPGVVGGIGPDRHWSSFRDVTLEVPEAGNYSLAFEGDKGGSVVRFGPCSGCPWEFRGVQVLSGEVRSLWLDPGKHYLRILARSDATPDVEVVLSPM